MNHYKYTGTILLYENLSKIKILGEALERFIERLSFKTTYQNYSDHYIMINGANYYFVCTLTKNLLDFMLTTSEKIDLEKIENIVLEIFHTYNYRVFDESINFEPL